MFIPLDPDEAKRRARHNAAILMEAARRLAAAPDRRSIEGALAIAARHLSPAAMIMHKPMPTSGRVWACTICGLACAHHAPAWRRLLFRLTRRPTMWGQW